MQPILKQFTDSIQALAINVDKQLIEKYKHTEKDEENKNLKKKIKKYQVENDDNIQVAIQKANKFLEEIFKSYQNAGKQQAKLKQFDQKNQLTNVQKNKKMKDMVQKLYTNFKAKYDQQIKKANSTQTQQQNKRKAIIQQLQQRIKKIQGQYEETGKIKIQKYKQNQTLKHELSKYQPHLIASQSLADAQLKKKTIQIQIQMTALKQKIQMMSSFKKMKQQTEQKLKKSLEVDEKVTKRLSKINAKQQEHKISLAKAHLSFEQYKKTFNSLRDQVLKKQKQSMAAKERQGKSQDNLKNVKNDLLQAEKQYTKDVQQLQGLKKLKEQLEKQLAE